MVNTRANNYDESEGEQSPNPQLDLVQQAENDEETQPNSEQPSQSTNNASLGVPTVPGMLEHAEFDEFRTNILELTASERRRYEQLLHEQDLELQEQQTKADIQTGNYRQLQMDLEDLQLKYKTLISSTSPLPAVTAVPAVSSVTAEPAEAETNTFLSPLVDRTVIRALIDAIPVFEDNSDLRATTTFILRVEELTKAMYPQTYLLDPRAVIYPRTKLSSATLEELSELESPLLDWKSLKHWLLTRRVLILDSKYAKADLLKQRQSALKLDPRAYFYHLKRISNRITPHGERDADLRHAFATSLNPNICAQVCKQYDQHIADCARSGGVVTNEWLIERAIIEDRYFGGTTTQPVPSISAIPGPATTITVPEAFKKGVLTQAGRDFFVINRGCFFCRKLGHIMPTCATFAAFKTANPGKVRHPLSANPSLVTSLSDGVVDSAVGINTLNPIALPMISALPMAFATPVVCNVSDVTAEVPPLLDSTPLPKWAPPGNRFIFNAQVLLTPSPINCSLLLDSGCDGMVMGAHFAELYGLPVNPCTARTVAVANGSSVHIDSECTARISVGSFRKDITFSIANVTDDLIFGVPFFQIIRIINSDWKTRRFQFVSRSGSRHLWYGADHQLCSSNTKLIYMCSAKMLMQDPASETYSINVRDFVDRDDGIPINTRMDDNVTTNTSLHPAEPPSNSEQLGTFLATLAPDLANVLRPFLNSVLSDPPTFSEIPSRPEDQRIHLKPGVEIRARGLRRHSLVEDSIIQEKITELMDRGFIRPSSSEFGANLIFAKKKDGGLRMCIDYRELNNATVKDRTPLPSHCELRERVKGSKFLTKVDIRDAFHMIRIFDDDCHKTAFKTRYGLFEYTVSPFGLSNSPATFMRLMNRVFLDLMDRCVVFYVDDILIYSESYAQHLLDVQAVFERLAQHHLHVKLTKCIFAVSELEFCGMNVSIDGFSIQESQVSAVCNYPPKDPSCSSKKYVQQLMGSVRFFADFIPWLADIAQPLFQLTKNDNIQDWGVEHQSVFRIIQFYLTTAPVLSYFDSTRPQTYITSDASDFAIGGWLGQTTLSGDRVVISYWSRQMIQSECHYPVHEREFLSLFCFIKKFRMYLHGVPFTAYVDHRSLEHMQTQPHLSARQVRWIQFLQEFEFDISYLEGAKNTFADWLSRRPDYAHFSCPHCRSALDDLPTPSISSMINPSDTHSAQHMDPFCQQLEEWLQDRSSIPSARRGYFKSFSKNADGSWLYRRKALVVPEGPLRLQYLEFFHDRLDHGHFGFYKTMEAMKPHVYWPTLVDDLTKFLASCETCQRTKPGLDRNAGLLHPLPVPETRFQSVNIDFAAMPLAEDGYNNLMVIVDRFTKLVELIPANDSLSAERCAELLYRHWYLAGRGFPNSIVSDRDARFASNVWGAFCKVVGIERVMSTSRHQQTDGGAEAIVKIVKTVLKGSVNHSQTDWAAQLPVVQFAYNNSTHSATGFTPFYLANAFNPTSFPEFQPTSGTLGATFQKYYQDLDTAHANIYKYQQRMTDDYNRKHHVPHVIAVGDFVLLNREGIQWSAEAEVSRRLLQPFLGPFKVSKINLDLDNYTLDLPPTLRCHPTFHVSLLRKWHSPETYFVNRHISATNPAPELLADGFHYEVESILQSRWRGRNANRFQQFLIRWKGYDRSHDSWEPIACLSGSPDLLAAFLARDSQRSQVSGNLSGGTVAKGRLRSRAR